MNYDAMDEYQKNIDLLFDDDYNTYKTELSNKLLDELHDEGYSSFRERDYGRSFEQALRDYDRKLSNPYDY